MHIPPLPKTFPVSTVKPVPMVFCDDTKKSSEETNNSEHLSEAQKKRVTTFLHFNTFVSPSVRSIYV
jgi:hypothetical protein